MKRRVPISLILTLAFAANALIFVGCNKPKKPDGMPELFSGVVKLTQENEPLEGATVLFVTDDPKITRWAVSGQTDANGVAKLFTMGKFEGAPAGSFTVLVTKDEVAPLDESTLEKESDKYNPRDIYALVDLKFSTRETSPLSATVDAKNGNEFEFDLGEKVRELRPKESI